MRLPGAVQSLVAGKTGPRTFVTTSYNSEWSVLTIGLSSSTLVITLFKSRTYE